MKIKMFSNIAFWYKRNYRVTEILMGDGIHKFCPEKRFNLIFWKSLLDPSRRSPGNEVEYHTLKEANRYIYKLVQAENEVLDSKRVAKTEHHIFDEVFHIMSTKESDSDTSDTQENTSA